MKVRSIACIALAVAVGVAGGCGRGEPVASDRAKASNPHQAQARTIVSLGDPALENRGVSAAVSDDRMVAVWAVTADAVTDILAAVSTDAGATFGDPVRVNDIPGDARVNGEQPPRAAFAGTDIVVIWQSRRTGQPAVRASRSRDGGRTFDPAVTLHDETLMGVRGWSSVAASPSGDVHVAWLDTRAAVKVAAPVSSAPVSPAGAHAHNASTRQDVYHAVLRRDGTRADDVITTNVCFCCKTSSAVAPDGALFVAFRHIYPGNLRDMAVARSADGGRTFSEPVRVNQDGWELTGCPEDGPAIAVDAAGVLHVAWPTITDTTATRKGIFYAYSLDGGRTFAPRMRLDEGSDVNHAQHPQMSVANGRAIVVWDESTAAGPRIRARIMTADPKAAAWSPQLQPVLTVSEPGPVTYPAIAASAGGFAVLWTETNAAGAAIRSRAFRFGPPRNE